jgi:site-specific recombinase XerD
MAKPSHNNNIVLEKCQLKTADFKKWKSPVLFLSPATNPHGDGRLNPRVIKTVFKEVCILAGVEGHPPHAARHAMGRHLFPSIREFCLKLTLSLRYQVRQIFSIF